MLSVVMPRVVAPCGHLTLMVWVGSLSQKFTYTKIKNYKIIVRRLVNASPRANRLEIANLGTML
jgi:hypothetical protein